VKPHDPPRRARSGVRAVGNRGYDDLRRGAAAVQLADGLVVQVASPADVIRSREAAKKDRAQLPIMRRTLEEIRALEADRQRKT
jgi:hypothetical protein